ncbi:MAG: hypothetical protein ACI4OY_07285 [Aristaeellaceae bacterium]
MQAVITDVLGSEGLRPMTQGLPAAMLPLLDEPLAGLTLHLLRRHGVRRTTILSRDERIMAALGDGSLYGMSLAYADAWPKDAEAVLLLRGDVVTDMDLSALMDRHRENGGACEAVAAEKPHASLSALVMAGKTLRCMPVAERLADVLSALRSMGIPTHSVPLRCYWHAVEDTEGYRLAQRDLLEGRVGLPVRGSRRGSAIVAPGVRLPGGVRVTGRCYVGPFARVEPGAVLGPGTVLGRGAQVGRRAYLENACLWENARADPDAILRNVMVIPRMGNIALQQMIHLEANYPRNGS